MEPSEDVESINPLQCYREPQVNVNAAGQRRLGCRAWSAKERVTLKHIYHSEAEKKGSESPCESLIENCGL